MARFNNSTPGKVTGYLSALNFFQNLFEWVGIAGGKTVGVWALDKAEQSAAVEGYSMAGGASTEPVALVGSKIVGSVGSGLVGAGTVADLTARSNCSIEAYPQLLQGWQNAPF
jgi:hypothetical protein